MRRYLFGPVPQPFAEQNLTNAIQSGACLTYHTKEDAGADVTLSWGDSWDDVVQLLPSGWRPDAVFLYLPYTVIPAGLWSAPVPVVGLAGDAHSLWPLYQKTLPLCDVVVCTEADRDAVAQRCRRRVHAAPLGVLQQALPSPPENVGGKDIDVLLMTGEPGTAPGPWRIWLNRFAELADRWRVKTCCLEEIELFAELCPRTRIVFALDRAVDQTRWLRCAMESQALVFVRTDATVSPAVEQDGNHYIEYRESNWLYLLEHYLTHEGERCDRVRPAAGNLHEHPLPGWDQIEKELHARGPLAMDISRHRFRLRPDELLLFQSHQTLQSGDEDAAEWIRNALISRLADDECDPAIAHALGLLYALAGQDEESVPELAPQAMANLRETADAPDVPFLAQFNSLLAKAHFRWDADEIGASVRSLLAQMTTIHRGLAPSLWDGLLFPAEEEVLRYEWARICWNHALMPSEQEQAKWSLVRWRLHQLAGVAGGESSELYEAVAARPDLASSQALLGYAAANAGQSTSAMIHLRQSLQLDPQQPDTAARLFGILQHSEDTAGRENLRRHFRFLQQIAPAWFPPETWQTLFPPPGNELASVVVVCGDILSVTRRCLESVLAHTRPPYDLIVVNSGTADETSDYLRELQSKTVPKRLVVLQHTTPVSPAAMKQALGISEGEYIVQLDDDVVVTAGWLDGLIAASLSDWPRVGLAGPASNDAPPPQLAKAEFDHLDGLALFAAHRRRRIERRWEKVSHLSAFCMLIRRDVLRRFDGPDGTANVAVTEADQFCRQVQQLGFECRVAQDVYVHRPTRPSHADSMIIRPPRLPSGKTRSATVSLCMIVKNEEDNLAACLAPATPLVDEIVVVDTGSTDRTKEIAISYGAKVVDFPWVDSFAAARNESLRHATCDWVFWLDADDRLDAENQHKLKCLFDKLPNELAAYLMRCVCPTIGDANHSSVTVAHARLFRRRPELRWRYRVHEQILLSVNELGGKTYSSDVEIRHEGYHRGSILRDKLERNLALLRKNAEEAREDAYVHFYLGWTYMQLDQFDEAIASLEASRRFLDPRLSIAAKLFCLLINVYRRLGFNDKAWDTCREGRRQIPDDSELLFLEGGMHLDDGNFLEAEQCFLHLIGGETSMPLSGVDAGIHTYKAHHNLAVVYQRRKQWAEAERHWQQCLLAEPGFLPAWLGLGETYLLQKKAKAAEQTAADLEAFRPGSLEGMVLRARLLAFGKQFDPAQSLLQEAANRYPELVLPRVVAAQILRRKGADAETLLEAWRAVLAIDPKHAEAQKKVARYTSAVKE